MGLTKIRAGQISNIDYKQSCRVLTDSDISLTGGAPSLVDSVSLMINDRVLVTGQDDKTENGLYRVSILGTGVNGTWVRTSDTDAAGELEAGAIVMVTEGTAYQDTQWKLITNDPIVIGESELTFEQNSAFAFGNIWANGTAVLANTVGDTLTLTAGNNISISGNAQSKTVTFDVVGISLTSISDGTSNVTVTGANGNVIIGVGGNTVSTFTQDSLIIQGSVIGNGAALTGINAFGNIAVAGETTVSADNTSDTLTFAKGTGISIVTDAANNTITIGSVATDSIFATGGDMGTITEAVTVSEDLGLITDAVTVEYDLGLIVTAGIIQPDSLILPSKTVAELANLSASPQAQFVYCSDESGGAVPAFSDGVNWRRVTDRAIIT